MPHRPPIRLRFALSLAVGLLAACDPPRAPADPPAPGGTPVAAPIVTPGSDEAIRLEALRGLRDPDGQPVAPQVLASHLLVVSFWSPF